MEARPGEAAVVEFWVRASLTSSEKPNPALGLETFEGFSGSGDSQT